MPKICKYIDCISQRCKKYAVKMCKNMQLYMQIYILHIFHLYALPPFADDSVMKSMKVLSDLSLDRPWGQVFSWLLTLSSKLENFTSSAYGMEKDGQKSWDQKCFINWNFSTNFCCWLFYDVHLIVEDHIELGCALEIWDLLHWFFGTANKLVFPNLHQKA